jgi:hypothetical protein
MVDLVAGCRAKLDRAQELINLLQVDAEHYFEQFPVRLEKEHRNDGLEFSLVAYGDEAPPARFAVIAGEIIHHMRSSLDHLVHALVLKNGGKPGRFNQFPICTTERAFKDSCNRRQLDGIPSAAKALVASVQPFTSPTPDDTILHMVSEFDNTDKHRLLVVVTAMADVTETIHIGHKQLTDTSQEREENAPAIVGFGPFGPKPLSKEGVPVFTIKLQTPAPEFTADAPVLPTLSFEQCGRVQYAPLISTLQNLLYGTGHTVNMFKEFV